MRTVVLGEAPRELIAAQERRRRHGLDLFDEVWQAEYHIAPAPDWGHGYVDDQLTQILGPYARAAGLLGSGPFNLGDADDYRVPDHGYHRIRPTAVFVATAVVVVEVNNELAAVTPWELGIKRALGKLVMPDGLVGALVDSGFVPMPITAQHAELAPSLPPHHKDPFDRMLIAQAQLESLALVTADSAIEPYGIPLINARL